MLSSALGSDVRLRAGRDGGVLAAHRAILAARCDVFRYIGGGSGSDMCGILMCVCV